MKNIENLLRKHWECCNAIDRWGVNYAFSFEIYRKRKSKREQLRGLFS